jgi:hypothetical protein
MIEKSKRLEIETRLMNYRSLARRVVNEETVQRINLLTAELAVC